MMMETLRMERVPWYGITCCLGAAGLYLLGKTRESDVKFLRSARRVSSLKDLGHILDTKSDVSPLIVTVSGRVNSSTPIKCECIDMKGVIVEEESKQHFMKQDKATDGKWIKDTEKLSSTSKVVPWYLEDGTDRAYVVGALDASGLTLTVTSKFFEPAPGTVDCVQGIKMLGVQRIERVLPTGIFLTVVGEAVKDGSGIIYIQRPFEGPFYVSRESIDQLIPNVGEMARRCKYASLAFAVVGVFLIAVDY